MSNLSHNVKQIVLAGSALVVAVAAPIQSGRLMGYDVNVISAASAAEDGHGNMGSGKGRKGGGAGQGMGGQGAGGGGSGKGSKSLESSVLKAPAEDSDRPAWAGVKGGKSGGGGKPAGAGSKKGDLYGDLFVLIRDPITGVALTETINGVVYPLVQAYDANGTLLPGVSIPRDAEGNLLLTGTKPDGTTYVYTTQEVEFGRLSVGRAPSKVLDHSLVEALSKLTTGTISLDASGRLVITTIVDGVPVTSTIDSPLENLALYKAIANLTGTDRTISITATASDGGGTTTYTWTVPTAINIDLLKASLLAAASDKTSTFTLDTLMYTNPIVGVTDDLSTFTYDRYTTYKDTVVTVLVKQPDGVTYIATPVNIYEVLFNSTNDTTAAGAADFAQAVDDALQVIEYIHDNEVR